MFLGLYVTQIGTFSFEEALKDWFKAKGLLYRIAFFQICGLFERSKYYAIWTLTEGASIITGNGFTGYGSHGESLWTGAANVDVLNIELGPNFKVLLDSWNMKTNVWLRECVYKRVTPKGTKPGFTSGMITFMTSAFWVRSSFLLFFFSTYSPPFHLNSTALLVDITSPFSSAASSRLRDVSAAPTSALSSYQQTTIPNRLPISWRRRHWPSASTISSALSAPSF